MCTGTLVHYEQTVSGRARGQGAGCGECVRVHRYTMSKQSRDEREALHPGRPGHVPARPARSVRRPPAVRRPPGRGLPSFTLELNLSNSRTHSWFKLGYTVDRRAQVELKSERV